jgi:hypothetical protein
VNSADVWYEGDDEETRNADDLESLLGLSVELVDTMNAAMREVEMEAAKQRHPSGKMVTAKPEAPEGVTLDILTAADRCDQGCGGAALYRLHRERLELDFCHHHYGRLAGPMEEQGWVVSAVNGSLLNELYRNRLGGESHA